MKPWDKPAIFRNSLQAHLLSEVMPQSTQGLVVGVGAVVGGAVHVGATVVVVGRTIVG